MEFATYIFLGCVPFVAFQIYRGFASSPNELRDENNLKIYEGQDRWHGSREANDEIRIELEASGLQLNLNHTVEHCAVILTDTPRQPIDQDTLVRVLEEHGFDSIVGHDDHKVTFTAEYKLGSMVFDRKTMELNDFLFEYGWGYSGWHLMPDEKGKHDES